MSEDKYQIILSALAEQEKEHGYFVLAGKEQLRKEEEKISPCPFAVGRSTATLFWLSHFKNGVINYEEKKHWSLIQFRLLNLQEYNLWMFR